MSVMFFTVAVCRCEEHGVTARAAGKVFGGGQRRKAVDLRGGRQPHNEASGKTKKRYGSCRISFLLVP
ncbi:MAG: hypothetical protein KH384_08245 [Corynebacteriales bacterium]|nr:hypothetical protein [Mycobacteriales bacterium]